tara:strand:+ start:3520 stop:4005 length:486 start_codon:yes stop_codon:yes gene_type:complete
MTNPVKKINILDAVKLFFKNYFNFTGRASRSEYWWFFLAYIIVAIVISIAEGLVIGIEYAGSGLASKIFSIAFMIGWLSLNARRLQDRGHTGWWQLAYLVPIIPIIYFMFLFLVAQNTAYGIALGLSVILLIGILITLIVVCCLPPKEDENKWGRNPLLLN